VTNRPARKQPGPDLRRFLAVGLTAGGITGPSELEHGFGKSVGLRWVRTTGPSLVRRTRYVTADQLEMISTDLTELSALSVKAGQPQLAGSS
jgi:hypothetical protein